MKYKLEKNIKIANELVCFCYKKHGKHIEVAFSFFDGETTIKVGSYIENLTEKALKQLKESLCAERQHEVEECFWLANGEDSMGDELSLIGVMVDDAKINYEDSVLTIELKRVEVPKPEE